MPTNRADSIASYIGLTAASEQVAAQIDSAAPAVFDHPNGGFVDQIIPSNYGLHLLSAGFANAYEFAAPGTAEVGLLAIVATTAFAHTVAGPFADGTTVVTFGGAVGDALLVYVGAGQLTIVGAVNVALGTTGGVFDHPNGGFVDRIVTTDYGLHTLSAVSLQAYEFDTVGASDFGLIDVVATSAYAHTLDGPFVGGFTTATFGGAVGDAMQVRVAGGNLYVVGVNNVVLS